MRKLIDLQGDNPEDDQTWYSLFTEQLAAIGFDDSNPVPFYECWLPGENAKPEAPKPPLLMPVTKPTEAFLAEHGQFGRYDQRSPDPAVAENVILSPEQEEGLQPDNGVFLFELFNFKSHFGINSGNQIADQIISYDFAITDRFQSACQNRKAPEKLCEIAGIIKNAAERVGFDVSQINSKQWAGIFRHSNSILLGTINMPNYKFQAVAGVTDHKFPMERIAPFPILHSIASQIHTRPVLERIYGEPAAFYLNVLEK